MSVGMVAAESRGCVWGEKGDVAGLGGWGVARCLFESLEGLRGLGVDRGDRTRRGILGGRVGVLNEFGLCKMSRGLDCLSQDILSGTG